MKNLRTIFAAAVLAGSMIVVSAQSPSPLPVDPDVRIGRLDNGLTYYIRHNGLPEKQADFYIAQKVGSILEEDDQRGLAHFLEHMCFNGTTHFPGNALREYLETIGVKFGSNLNAYTSIDETVYNITNVPVVRDGIIDSCLLVLHDWANDLTLAPEEIDKERGVIHEEWRTSMGAMMRMYEQVFPVIYQDSRYGHRLPIGSMDVVDHFPYQALRDYYEKWYRPDLQGIIVVGDINVDSVEQKIKRLFSPIRMPENPAEREYFPVADNAEPIITVAKDKEQEVPVVYLFHKHDVIPDEQKNSVEYLAANYMTWAIEEMLNSRISERMQQANPPFIQSFVSDENFLLSKTKGAFTGIAVTKEDGILTGTEAMMREIERVRRFGFTASEYARAKADYLRGLEVSYNERDKQRTPSYVNEYLANFLNGEPIPGAENYYGIMSQIVPSIPIEAINEWMKQLIREDNVVLSVFCPEKEGMVYPTETELKGIIEKVRTEKLDAYVDKVSNEPLLKEKPQGGKVLKTESGAFGTTVLTLSNGVRVIVKHTDFKADELLMSAFSPGGTSLFDNKDVLQFSVINEVASLGGVGNFSQTELDKVLAGKAASASTTVGTYSEGASGSCSPKDLETMLQLTYLRFTAPRTDADAFTSFVSRIKAALANQEANPMSAFSDSIQATFYNKNPRIFRMKADMIDKVDYAKVMELYKDRFEDAGDFTFLLVGNIDMAVATPLVEQYLGGLPAAGRKESFGETGISFRTGEHKNNFTRQLETPKSTIAITNSGTCPYTLKNKVLMSMTQQLLDILYMQTIREDEGGTYGVRCGGSMGKYPEEKAVFQIYFDTDPDRREELTGLIRKGLDDFIANGPKSDDLNKVKEYMLKTYQQNQKENGYWIGVLNEFYWNKLDVNTGYEALVNSITPADLQEFAKAFFGQDNQVEVSMSSPDNE